MGNKTIYMKRPYRSGGKLNDAPSDSSSVFSFSFPCGDGDLSSFCCLYQSKKSSKLIFPFFAICEVKGEISASRYYPFTTLSPGGRIIDILFKLTC
mmetsp:Transcript_25896/g.58408  ORF Transcript_25896/g.58408 Transcript_25896/m.58408 type:complete len:96 (-) Transcript_25896:580-867(-)